MIGSRIFNSKFQSPSFYSLSQKLNIPNRNDRYPGPGSYISFSEFGILDPNYKKRMRLQTEPQKTRETEETKNEETNEKKEEIKVNNEEKYDKNKIEENKNDEKEYNDSPKIDEEANNENYKSDNIKGEENKEMVPEN